VGKVRDAKEIINEEVLLGPDRGWTPGFKGLLFDPLGKLRLNPELATPDLINDNEEELRDPDWEALQPPPPEPTKKKKEKKAKEVKKPLSIADLERAGVPINDQLRQVLKEENRRATRKAAEQDGKKAKGPRPRGWQMPEPDNREVHKLLKIVGGQASGKRLLSPADRAVRPMMEVVRAAVFNMLQSMVGLPTLEGRWLDLYSGTGSVGLEALSRGCDTCHFVELDPWVVTNVLQPNIDNCDFNSESVIHTQKVEAFFDRAEEPGAISGGAFDFISVTPPYEAVTYSSLMTTLATSPIVGKDTFIIVEYPYRDKAMITEMCGNLYKIRDRRYGRTNLAMYGPEWAKS
jgi:16S rRNA (guanine(966)-N(2))-methyltransferase RsmD